MQILHNIESYGFKEITTFFSINKKFEITTKLSLNGEKIKTYISFDDGGFELVCCKTIRIKEPNKIIKSIKNQHAHECYPLKIQNYLHFLNAQN